MTSVFLNYFDFFEYKEGNDLPDYHKLQRRMSFLQKSMIGVTDRAINSIPLDLFGVMANDCNADILFTTSFGELFSVGKIATMIFQKDLPISPVAFQHSVNNAAAGYLSIIHGHHKGIMVSGSGGLELDKAIFKIFFKCKYNPYQHYILIHCDESLREDGSVLSGRSYLLIFSGNKYSLSQAPLAELKSVQYLWDDGHRFQKEESDIYCFSEGNLSSFECRLKDGFKRRAVTTCGQEWLVTEWYWF